MDQEKRDNQFFTTVHLRSTAPCTMVQAVSSGLHSIRPFNPASAPPSLLAIPWAQQERTSHHTCFSFCFSA